MFDPLLACAVFVLGLIGGSFLNALLFRFNTGESVMHGRSKCMHCGHILHARDLVPVLSFVLLGGRCRFCGSKISWQYPLVEVAGGLLSFGVYTVQGATPTFVLWFLVWMTLLFIVVYDLKHTVIPWSASFFLLALSLLILCTVPFELSHVLAGPLLALPLVLLSLVSAGTWMGWGDGTLELSLGWLLGLLPGLGALALGIWSGALVGILLVVYSQIGKRKARAGFTMKSELPFAPFLVLGVALVYFLHVDLFSSLAALW